MTRILGFAALIALAPVGAAFGGEDPDGHEVILERGPITITQDDVRRELKMKVPAKHRAALLADEPKLRQFIANIYAREQLAQEGREAGVHADPQVRYEMAAVGRQKLASAYLDRQVEKRLPGEAQLEKLAREYYNAHPEEFARPAEVHAAHILIGTDDRSEEEARAKAEALREKAEGLDAEGFAELAREHSDDRSAAKNGGDLGWFAREQMVKPFSEAAFALTDPGEISDVVKTRYGYHVIRFMGRKEPGTRPFEAVKRGIVEQLLGRERSKARQKELARINTLEDIEVDQEAIAELVKRPDFRE